MMQSTVASCPRESITIAPITTAAGTVQLPGSKSISNRALFLAAMKTVTLNYEKGRKSFVT